MGRIRTDRPKVYFFCAITYAHKSYCLKATEKLCQQWGNILVESAEYLFSELTPYYEKEMGKKLYKKFILFSQPIELEGLHKAKLFSNQTEDEYIIDGTREVNIDPGYINEAKVVLFSTKDFAHRLYLNDGIFAEITLSFKAKEGFTPLPWTFPDYKIGEHLVFFNLARENYRKYLGK